MRNSKNILLLLLAVALPAAAQITHSSGCNGSSNSTATTRSCTLTVPANGTVAIAVQFANGSSPTINSVAGSLGETYAPEADSTTQSGTYRTAVYLSGTIAAGGSDTVTVTLSAAASYWNILPESFSGVAGADGAQALYTVGTVTVTYTTTVSNDYLIVWDAHNSGQSVTVNSGWTLLQGAGVYEGSDEGFAAGAPVTNQAITVNPGYTVGFIALKPSAGGGTPCVPTLALLGVGGACG